MNEGATLWGEVAPVFLTTAATIAAAVIGALVTWATVRVQHKGKPENALIDQLQEQMADRDEFWRTQISSIRATAEDAKATADRAESKANKAERRERLLMDYAARLRRQIEDGHPPPPIEWPNLD